MANSIECIELFLFLTSSTADASYQLIGSRLKDILSNAQRSQSQPTYEFNSGDSPNQSLDKFHHFTTPTLPHLLALLLHQSSSFPPPETSLLVIDSIATLFALAFPNTTEVTERQQTPVKKTDAAQWASGRRWSVMGELVSKIGRLAATQNIAILLTSQMTTRIRFETGAVLHPAISGGVWDAGIGTQVILFRDWMFQTADNSNNLGGYMPGVVLAGVTKTKGVAYEGVGRVATFRIQSVSVRDFLT